MFLYFVWGANLCNGWVGQDLCVPNVCPPFDVDKDQVRYTSFQGLTFTNSCTISKELSVRVKSYFLTLSFNFCVDKTLISLNPWQTLSQKRRHLLPKWVTSLTDAPKDTIIQWKILACFSWILMINLFNKRDPHFNILIGTPPSIAKFTQFFVLFNVYTSTFINHTNSLTNSLS